jgi:hypothetical protein
MRIRNTELDSDLCARGVELGLYQYESTTLVQNLNLHFSKLERKAFSNSPNKQKYLTQTTII